MKTSLICLKMNTQVKHFQMSGLAIAETCFDTKAKKKKTWKWPISLQNIYMPVVAYH